MLSARELKDRFPTAEPGWLASLAATGQLTWRVEQVDGVAVPTFDEDQVAEILADYAAGVLQSGG